MRATITWQDGTTTRENVLTEVESVVTDDQAHEFTTWDNGSVSIDSLLITGVDAEHVSLTRDSVRRLRDFLNSVHLD